MVIGLGGFSASCATRFFEVRPNDLLSVVSEFSFEEFGVFVTRRAGYLGIEHTSGKAPDFSFLHEAGKSLIDGRTGAESIELSRG
jgi:hypothetical protein